MMDEPGGGGGKARSLQDAAGKRLLCREHKRLGLLLWQSRCFSDKNMEGKIKFVQNAGAGVLHPTRGAAAEPYRRCSTADGTGQGKDGAGRGHPAAPCIPLASPRRLVPAGERRQPRAQAWAGESRKSAKAYFPPKVIFWALPFAATTRTLTVRVLQLSHGSHKRLLRHMAG